MRNISEKNITLGLPWAVSLVLIIGGGLVTVVQYVAGLSTSIEVIKEQVHIIDQRTARSTELEVELARFDERLRALQLAQPASQSAEEETRRTLAEILRQIQIHAPRAPIQQSTPVRSSPFSPNHQSNPPR